MSLSSTKCLSPLSSSYKIKEINRLFYLKEFKENMKKKALLLASMGVLACTVGATVLVVGGANQLDTFAVKADPVEYSVTFDWSESTTIETVDEHYAIGTTTASGNKVGVVGWYNEEADFTFNGVSFQSLMLHHYEIFTEDAYSFSTITGFAISFSGEEKEEPEPVDVTFRYGEEMIYHVDSGTPYKGLSVTTEDMPEFIPMVGEGDSITVTSLTIWYSC